MDAGAPTNIWSASIMRCANSLFLILNRFKHYSKKNPPTAALREAKNILMEQIDKVLKQLGKTESVLLEAGAKTYHQLHPEFLEEIKAQEARQQVHAQKTDHGDYKPDEKKPKEDVFKVPFNFLAPYLGEGSERHKVEAGYIKL